MPDTVNSTLKNEEMKNLLEWRSPSRPFKKRDRDYFTTIGAMVFLIVVILFFIKEWLLIGAILSFTFLVYILNTIPPEEIDNKITNKGITSANHTYLWSDLREFWFAQKFNQTVLVVQTKMNFPKRILILLGTASLGSVKEALLPYLTFKETPEKNWMDNAGEWLSKRVPLEKTV